VKAIRKSSRNPIRLNSQMPSLGPMDWLRHHFTQLGILAANPVAFFIVCAYGVLWFLFERETFNWHAIATLATWMMTLFIQRSEHRDTQAIHAKLDELLRSDPKARTELAQLDDEEPEDIEAMRRQRTKRQDN
jgi:low affinity Fe/Cu permease